MSPAWQVHTIDVVATLEQVNCVSSTLEKEKVPERSSTKSSCLAPVPREHMQKFDNFKFHQTYFTPTPTHDQWIANELFGGSLYTDSRTRQNPIFVDVFLVTHFSALTLFSISRPPTPLPLHTEWIQNTIEMTTKNRIQQEMGPCGECLMQSCGSILRRTLHFASVIHLNCKWSRAECSLNGQVMHV